MLFLFSTIWILLINNFLTFWFYLFIDFMLFFLLGWSSWTSWSDCSLSCGNGTKHRSRNCTNISENLTCDGSGDDSLSCYLGACPQVITVRHSEVFKFKMKALCYIYQVRVAFGLEKFKTD